MHSSIVPDRDGLVRVVVLAGGVGGAKLSHGLAMLAEAVGTIEAAVIVNTGDDLELHGLLVCPDLDTIMYTLAGMANEATGWGLRDETWSAAGMLERYGQETWFRLGDRDLGTHLYRTGRLAKGASLSSVTAEIAAAWDVEVRVLPATDDPLRTMVTVSGEGEIGFQDYFVGRQHSVVVTALRFDGADRAGPAPGVLDAIETEETMASGLGTMSEAGIAQNIETLQKSGIDATAEELFDTSILAEVYADATPVAG